MAIPGVNSAEDVPPPLPPPRHLPGAPGPYQTEDMSRAFHDRAPRAPSSYNSAYGSASSSLADGVSRNRRSPGSIAQDDRDEGYASWSSNERLVG